MNIALFALCGLLWQASQAPQKSCVIVRIHQHKFGENMNRFTAHRFYDYIEGDYPSGMKFIAELGKNQVRDIQEKGGKVVILQSGYQLPDLQDARDQCKAFLLASKTSP